jgi:mannose-6-phosphate isomerase
MGAHPRACSTLPEGQSLDDYIRGNPQDLLGAGAEAFGWKLPFLFKILAAARPLSIQCHPNLEQARAGFASENAAGIPVDATNRNYRDANHKPELIVALEEFWALKGFRDPAEIRRLLQLAEVKSLSPLLQGLEGGGGLADFFRELMTLPEPIKAGALGELKAGLSNLPEDESRWTRTLLELYPNDIAATSALVLQLVRLEAGQGLYLGAGELHAYLQGTGLEIMANSDNVLRGGLTPKHVDVDELMRVLNFEHHPPQILNPIAGGENETERRKTYPTPCREFTLSNVQLREDLAYEHANDSATIFLGLGGDTDFRWAEQSLVLDEGGVAFAGANTGQLEIRGKALLWIASFAS